MTAIAHEAVRETIRDAGRALGVPGPVAEAFVRLLRPCVYLCPFEQLPEELRNSARPAARAGGSAHLPEGVDVPAYVPHLVTVDCAAIPTGVLDIDFPDDGQVAVLAEVTDQDEGFVIYVPTGTETVERHPREAEQDAPKSSESFPLYAVAGTTMPGALHRSHVAEAVDYAEGDAERARRVDNLIDEMGAILAVRWGYGIQLGGFARAWHDPLEDRGNVLFLSIPESAVFGGDCITFVSGSREQIAERRYDELEFDVES
ncbi:hypothetical protein ACH4KN_09850 [Streptomyces sp. NPDC017546]|uniref:hypothetical protein n=1 Tax=unclassified Streptomyces TaxID=2593676 RepID=UPI00235E2188|nr:hypothetical protein [Streptomyces sp. MMBL 11-1]